MKTRLQISYKFLNANADSAVELAKFLLIKSRFVNGKIYNYTPTKTHKMGRLKWSRNTISGLVDKFLRYGWCRMEGKTLVFLSKVELSQLVSPKQTQFIFTKLHLTDNDYLNLVTQIRAIAVRSLRTRLVRRAYSVKRDKNEKRNSRRPLNRHLPLLQSQPHPVALSLIGKTLNCSISHAARWLNEACKLKLLRKFGGRTEKVGSHARLLDHIPNSYISSCKSVIVRFPSRLAFL